MAEAKRLPASIRNRNPGAQYPGAVSRRFGSTSNQVLRSKDGTHKIATFPSHVQGAAALFYLLASPAYADGRRTIRAAITKWCGGFYVSTYITVLETKAGVSRDTILTRGLVCNADVAIPIAKAMAWQEAGRAYPMTDAEWAEAHALALPDAASDAAPVTVSAPPTPLPTDVDGWDRAARSKPDERVAEAAVQSRTIRWSIGGVMSWIGVKIEEAYGLLGSAFDVAASSAGPGTPLGLLASAAKVSSGELIVCIGVGALVIIVANRLSDAEEGKSR